MRIRRRKSRGAIGENTCARIERAVTPGEHHRHGDDARQQTTKIGNDEIKSRSEQQEGPITDLTVDQSCRQVTGALIDLCERQNRLLLPVIRQEYAGATVRLLRGSITKVRDEGGEEQRPTHVAPLSDT